MEPKHRYEDLTWPEVDHAVGAGLIPVLPVGTPCEDVQRAG